MYGGGVPNIPGMRRNPQVAKSKSQGIGGQYVPKRNQGSATMTGGSTQLYDPQPGPTRYSKGPTFKELTAHTSGNNDMAAFHKLTFTAYWKEQVFESREKYRLRVVTIIFIIEDGTITVVERTQQNSGMPQGVFLKKHRVPRPGQPGKFYELSDLKVGSSVNFYGRKFYICHADRKTRQTLQARGITLKPDEPLPPDPFAESRMPKETKLLKTDMKEYMEASRGRAVGATKKLGNFLKYDRCVLSFECYWDDRHTLYGDLNRYTLHYFMADQTIEVLEKKDPNSGKGPFTLLLGRTKLPKNWKKDLHQIDKDKNSDRYYTDADLVIGQVVEVYAKRLVLTSCDANTQKYYREAYGMTDKDFEPIILEEDKPKPPSKGAELPPYRGGLASFGTDEDSAQSCLSLHPNKIKKNTEKLMANQNNLLRFMGRFADERPEDRGRRFVITFYMADDTVSVFEMANKNSGIVPGKFLKRMKAMKPDGSKVCVDDLGIGKTVTLNHQSFYIDGMDQFTERFTVNVKEVLTRLHHALARDPIESGSGPGGTMSLKAQVIFDNMDGDGSGFISRPELQQYIDQRLNQSVHMNDMNTIMRFFDSNNDGRISKVELMQFMQSNPKTWPDIRPGDSMEVLSYDETLRDAESEETLLRNIRVALRRFAMAFNNKTHNFWQIFQKFDKGKTNTVTRSQFSQSLTAARNFVADKSQLPDQFIALLAEYFFPEDCKTLVYRDFIMLLEAQKVSKGI